jgi:hypothetical protein
MALFVYCIPRLAHWSAHSRRDMSASTGVESKAAGRAFVQAAGRQCGA